MWAALVAVQYCGYLGALRAALSRCFTHLAGLAPGIDMASAYAHYAHGGPEQRSYVIELLDNVLDRSLKRRLFPLLEPRRRQARIAHALAASR